MSILSGLFASNSQDKATAANAKNATETNELNYRQFLEGRGQSGFASLPYYAATDSEALTSARGRVSAAQAALDAASSTPFQTQGNGGQRLLAIAERNRTIKTLTSARDAAQKELLAIEKQPGGGKSSFEAKAFDDTARVYDATNTLTPEQKLAQYRDSLAGWNTAQQESDAAARGLFDRSLNQEELNNFQQVADARTGAAKATYLQAIEKSLGNISANMRRGGFSGTGTPELAARFDASRQGFNALANVGVQNASQIYDIKQNDINRRINNLNLPYTQARTAAQQIDLPNNLLRDDQNARNQSVLTPFRITPSSFGYSPLPTVEANQGLPLAFGQTANQIGNYFADQQVAKKYAEAARTQSIRNQANYTFGALPATPAISTGQLIDSPVLNSSSFDVSGYA